MNQNRRKILKALGGAGAIAAAEPYLSFPAIAQSRTLAPERVRVDKRAAMRRRVGGSPVHD